MSFPAGTIVESGHWFLSQGKLLSLLWFLMSMDMLQSLLRSYQQFRQVSTYGPESRSSL